MATIDPPGGSNPYQHPMASNGPKEQIPELVLCDMDDESISLFEVLQSEHAEVTVRVGPKKGEVRISGLASKLLWLYYQFVERSLKIQKVKGREVDEAAVWEAFKEVQIKVNAQAAGIK